MSTAEFQQVVLEEVKEELRRGDIPVGEIQTLARRVLDLSAGYPSTMPEAAFKPLLSEFPELTRILLVPLKKEEEARSRREAEEFRRKLSQ